MNDEDKKEILRLLNNRIAEETHRIMTTTGKLADSHRECKERLISVRQALESEVTEEKPTEIYVNLSIPADCVPVLQNGISKIMTELNSKTDLESKRIMQKMLKLQIALMGGR